ncbi:MAG: AMP-binding protein, partial [Myxococcales bacterium]|nr:AMP-binding protein [Myxococcales bacterium]
GALDRTVRSLAARLQADGLQGERAMLIFEPGLDFVVAFVACLYAGVVPVPAYPPEPHRMAHTLARLKSIVIDAEAKVVLTSPLIRGFAETLVAQANSEAISALAWITVDETGAHTPEAWVRPAITDEGLAFLQYTSGS